MEKSDDSRDAVEEEEESYGLFSLKPWIARLAFIVKILIIILIFFFATQAIIQYRYDISEVKNGEKAQGNYEAYAA